MRKAEFFSYVLPRKAEDCVKKVNGKTYGNWKAVFGAKAICFLFEELNLESIVERRCFLEKLKGINPKDADDFSRLDFDGIVDYLVSEGVLSRTKHGNYALSPSRCRNRLVIMPAAGVYFSGARDAREYNKLRFNSSAKIVRV